MKEENVTIELTESELKELFRALTMHMTNLNKKDIQSKDICVNLIHKIFNTNKI